MSAVALASVPVGMSQLLTIFIVDAFTINNNTAFTGNPAGVCFLEYDDDISNELKQKIASELNLSETAFVSLGWSRGEKLKDSQALHRTIRYFTPTVEVDQCGHATLASMKVFAETQDPNATTISINFETITGEIVEAEWNSSGLISLTYPAIYSDALDRSEHSWIDDLLRAALGEEVSLETVVDLQYSPISEIFLVRLNTTDELSPAELIKKVSPDPRRLLQIDSGEIALSAISVTVKGEGGEEGAHFHSRLFAPWLGVDEDPVNGYSHTVLTPYWTREWGSQVLVGRQESKRGGLLYCDMVRESEGVRMAGEARIMIKGELMV